MSWSFFKLFRRRVNPLDSENFREIEAMLAQRDFKGGARALKSAREAHGGSLAVRYLEALCYRGGSDAKAADLLDHLRPCVQPTDGIRFPEAMLLKATLLGSLGRFDQARDDLEALLGDRKLDPTIAAEARQTLAEADRLGRSDAVANIAREADALASELARHDLVIRWRLSDLARIDSLLDEVPALVKSRDAWVSLLGEIVCRAVDARWRLAIRPEDRLIRMDSRTWPVGQALGERLGAGTPLYLSLHRARQSAFRELAGVPGVEVVAEPNVHVSVVADHIARSLLDAPVTSLAVMRQRPTPEGPIVLPVSFVDKGGALQVVYIETRPWEPERVADLRRWLGRLRVSGAAQAAVSVVSSHIAPPAVVELSAEDAAAHKPLENRSARGARSATPHSLDEPKLRWLDQKALVIERLIISALGPGDPTDMQILRRMQEQILTSLSAPDGELTPKNWNAVHSHGALYGRLLAANFDGRWTGLDDDRAPVEWQMLFPWGLTVSPIGRVYRLVRDGVPSGDLEAHFLEVKKQAEASKPQ